MYRRRDVELAVLLRRLLHEERLTVAGAKKRLRELGRAPVAAPLAVTPKQEVSDRATFIALRRQLTDLLVEVDRLVESEQSPARQTRATVTRATPSTAAVHSQKTSEEEIGTCPKPRTV